MTWPVPWLVAGLTLALTTAGGCTGGRLAPAQTDAATPLDAAAPGPETYDAASCLVEQKSFDSSCTQDNECVEVGFGSFCPPSCLMVCPYASPTAINVSDYDKYQAAVAAVPPLGDAHFGCACGTGTGATGWEGSPAYCEGGQCVGGVRPGDSGPGSGDR